MEKERLSSLGKLVMSNRQLFVLAIFALLPTASVAASYFSARNLLLTIFVLLGMFAFASVRRATSDRVYLVLLSSLSISLLLATSFVSRNLSGYDIHQEYYIFSQTAAQGWHPETQLVYNSVLSISILPTVLYTVTGLDGVWLFKTIFPLLYSVVPVLLYGLYRKFLSSQAAFLSVFLFMSYPTSYIQITTLGRQEIAELMLAALLLVSCTPSLRATLAGKLMTGILTVGLVTSHYSLAFIYLLLLVLSLVLAKGTRRITPLCSPSMFGFSILIVLSWYLLVSGGTALAELTGLIAIVGTGMIRDLFNPLSRPSVVVEALSFSGVSGVLHLANRVIQYLVQFLLLIGFVIFSVAAPKNASARTLFSSMIVAMVLLLSSVALPFFAFGLNFSRIYQIALLFIAPCFVYGLDGVASWLRRNSQSIRVPSVGVHISRRRLLAAILLTTYFLFVGGWVWAVAMDSPTSTVLDWQRMADSKNLQLKVAYVAEYTVAEDIQAAQWLKYHASSTRSVCADFVSSDHVLNSYGSFAKYLPQIPAECTYTNDYVYLSVFNTVNGTATQQDARTSAIVTWKVSDISATLGTMNVIYSGGAVVYLGP